MPKRAQKTLKNAIEFSGVGLHTGEEVQVRLEPAAVDHGVTFTRVDLEGRPSVAVKFEHLSTKERRTALRDGAAEVCTVEHLLAALFAFEVDNVSIEMNGEEVPGLDGSSLPFVEEIEKAGVVEQKAEKKDLTLDEPLYVRDGDISLIALPAEAGLSIEYHLVQPEGDLETIQSFSVTVDGEHFKREVAPARTFVMEREIEQLQAAGLGKGANTSNTLVMSPSGPRDNELRFPDELARHKVLDLIGDLALTGRPDPRPSDRNSLRTSQQSPAGQAAPGAHAPAGGRGLSDPQVGDEHPRHPRAVAASLSLPPRRSRRRDRRATAAPWASRT